MSFNTFGRIFRFTTWGESHGPALGAVVDGCPPGIALSEADIQPFLDARRPDFIAAATRSLADTLNAGRDAALFTAREHVAGENGGVHG